PGRRWRIRAADRRGRSHCWPTHAVPGVFSRTDPRSIARSLKRSAENSRRRKSNPFRSAMSMLNFYINRAGKGLSKTRRARLEAAKEELRDLYHRERRAA